MGPRAGLDWCGKYRLHRVRSPDRPARSDSDDYDDDDDDDNNNM